MRPFGLFVLIALTISCFVRNARADQLSFDAFVNRHYQQYFGRVAKETELVHWFQVYQGSPSAQVLSEKLHIYLSGYLRAQSKPLYRTCSNYQIIVYPDYWNWSDCIYSHTPGSKSVIEARTLPKAAGACNVPLYQCTYISGGNVKRHFMSTSKTCEGIARLVSSELLTYACRGRRDPAEGLYNTGSVTRYSLKVGDAWASVISPFQFADSNILKKNADLGVRAFGP